MIPQETIKNLIEKLNYYTKKYDEGCPEISDKEWDDLYFQLAALENETGIYESNSPTQKVDYQVVNELTKVEHNHKMLSLDKTKSVDDLLSFAGNRDVVIMAKLDGLTCSLRYLNGKLVSAETRGNGAIGEDITHNAMVIPSIPKRINYLDELVVDGEIICLAKDFESFANEYKNSRNFAAGSIRLLNSKECQKRNLTFIAWDVIKGCNKDRFIERLNFAGELGFQVVPWVSENINYAIGDMQDYCATHGYPIDGVVVKFDDIAYGESLGETAHHFKNAIAYKFYDEEYETKLRNIEWSMGRTGVLTPVAVYDDIDIDGSVCNRANLHNINIMTDLLGNNPYEGEKIWIYKANMIIPQVSKAEKRNVADDIHFEIPKVCPICGQPTQIHESDSGTVELYCSNLNCDGKLVNKLDHFCGKKGLDIKGLSIATLDKLIDWGWVNRIIDIYSLKDHANEWVLKPGFGEKSVQNILNAIEASKHCSLEAFIAAIGIPMVGRTIAKQLVKYFATYDDFYQAICNKFDFSQFDGFADSKSSTILNFDYAEANEIAAILDIYNDNIANDNENNQPLAGKKIVITGSVSKFKNRAELQAFIEKLGGKVLSSVSKNVDYLINNNAASTSSKNIAAKQMGIPILTEDEFLEKVN